MFGHHGRDYNFFMGYGGRGPWGGFGRGHGRRGWGDFRDFMGGPPPRAERGEVRYLVLDAIADQARHGYEVIQTIEQRSDGAYRPSPGVVYPTLQMLEEMGLARVSDRDGRKVYEITDEGRQELERHRDEVAEFYERSDVGVNFEEVAALMKTVAGLLRSLRRAAQRGRLSPSIVGEISTIVEDAVKKIEAALERADRRR
jgi:DNA-binding PadR family transcriptional regulator